MSKNLFTVALLYIFWQLKLCVEITDPAAISKGGTNFAVTFDGNAYYIGGANDKKIYRYEMTQRIGSPTNNIQTTHSLNINTMALSRHQYFIASGAKDYRIQVRSIETNALVCTLWHHNQVKAVVFDPTDDHTLFSAGVDDAIRRWDIATCKQTAEITPPQSVNSLDINGLGTQLAYGTLYGDVGFVDSDLITLTNSANAHLYCVLQTLYTNDDYYITIGHEARIMLWKNGVQISRLINIAPNRLIECSFMVKARYNDTFRVVTCTAQNNRVYLYKITNTSVTRFADHGFSRTPMWLIGHHHQETSLQWIIGSTTNLYYNFIYDSNSQQCSPHTGWHSVNKICRLCWYMIQGCHFCDDQNTCTTCMGGTYQSGGMCINCPIDCMQCSSPTNCPTCAPGYQQIGNSNKCRAMTGNQFGCFELGTSGSKCSQATTGYYVKNNKAQLCNNEVPGCLECGDYNGNDCSVCETGYYLSSSNCIRCNNTITGCIACANSSDCIACQIAFKYSGANLHCSNCHAYCLTCGDFYDTCLTCSDPIHHRQINGTNCQCQPGYYQNSTQAVCGLCSSVLNNCYLCDNTTICKQCHKDYFKVTAAGKTQCQNCNIYCQDCNGTSNNCTACNYVSYHRVLVGSSCNCDTGYVSLGGSVSCYDCAVLNDGCLACSNGSYCTSCSTGYYLNIVNGTYQRCEACPYYCPDCSQNGSSGFVCNTCPAGSFRTVIAGVCTCNTGYFDDNSIVICEKCSDAIINCDLCVNRSKCISCAAGLYPDQSNRICSACRPTCLSCGTYFTECTSCNISQNRILISGQCGCQSYAFEDNGVCTLCSTAIEYCNSCQNPYLCTGCLDGYTLQEDFKGCIDCAGSMNGCDQCTSTTNCTLCKNQFSLINGLCRCPNNKYTSTEGWGTCIDYKIPGLSSSLGVQLQAHQHQNNSLLVFIRFRAQVLYVLNQNANASIRLYINEVQHSLTFDAVFNNRINIRAELNQSYADATIKVAFDPQIFYNEKLLTLDNLTYSITRRRLYYYDNSQIEVYTSMKVVMTTVFYVFKWVFFGLTIIGTGHLIYPFVTFIQLIPIFLMINMCLPHNLSALLEAMLSFQVPSIVPLLQIKSDFTVFFPPMTYDYYLLRDYIIFGKLGDFILILLVNVLTKFDEGIVRMFPPGRIRRYLYQALVRRGYSVMSLCLLSVMPSLFLLAGVYIPSTNWQVIGEAMNYCCCLYIFGFYLAYNFNHASNLMNTKLLRNIDNSHCYYDLNSQQSGTNRAVLIVLIADIWLAGALFLVGTFPYFVGALIILTVRFISQISPSFYIGKIQFILRILQNLLLLLIFVMLFIFYLSEQQIQLSFEEAEAIGMTTQIFIFLYFFFCIIEKIVFNLKLETGWMKTKKVANQNQNQDVIFAQKIQEADANEIQSDISQNNRAFLDPASTFSKSNAFNRSLGPDKAKNFNQSQAARDENLKFIEPPSNLSNTNNKSLGQNNSSSYFNKTNRQNNKSLHDPRQISQYQRSLDPRKTDNYFSKTNRQKTKQQSQPNLRIKSANTSKYAKNHLELRYKAHQQTVLNRIDQQYDE